MEKELRLEYGIDNEDESATDSGGSENSDDLLEEVNHDEDNIEEMRKEVELCLNVSDADKAVLKFLKNCDETENCEYSEEISNHCDTDIVAANSKPDENSLVRPQDDQDEDENEDIVCDLTEISSQFKQVHDRSETRSVTSSTSTIHPDIVKARVKQSLEKRNKRSQPRRTVRGSGESCHLCHPYNFQIAKGEASAKTRSRRDNKNVIQTSQDAFWG